MRETKAVLNFSGSHLLKTRFKSMAGLLVKLFHCLKPMAFVHNGITLIPSKAWTHQDGRQFPARFILDVDIPTRESIGVTMVSDVAPAYYDQEYYWSQNNPKDLDQLKAEKIAETKDHCASVLRKSDELVTKGARRGNFIC